ncbi:type II toxin-antitoxin system PemK/MazF family toxin [Terribacillus sp. FSL K6-0262]|uniref:type II toxin-antitoxin system PemK/MazF family toxin n=1 Tax=Terribacillus sp. FSL K6-0262 TaxID=2921447 RepID=UPI0030EEB9E0
METPDRGDLIVINFNPQAGHEQAGRRTGIVLSPKNFNDKTGFAVVCPITNQEKGYPFEVALPEGGFPVPSGNPVTGVILSDQIKSLDWKARNIKVIGPAPAEVVEECLAKVATYLQ